MVGRGCGGGLRKANYTLFGLLGLSPVLQSGLKKERAGHITNKNAAAFPTKLLKNSGYGIKKYNTRANQQDIQNDE